MEFVPGRCYFEIERSEESAVLHVWKCTKVVGTDAYCEHATLGVRHDDFPCATVRVEWLSLQPWAPTQGTPKVFPAVMAEHDHIDPIHAGPFNLVSTHTHVVVLCDTGQVWSYPGKYKTLVSFDRQNFDPRAFD
jgi:hypothetical protein